MNTTITKSALWLVVSLSAGSVWSQAASGPLALEPAGGPVVISKVPVADCRVVRGCFGSPIDGSVHSWDYRGTVREYPKTASDGVGYAYNNNDGVHLTLADDKGLDAVVLRGGAKTRLYVETGSLEEPQGVEPLHVFDDGESVQVARFAQRVRQRAVVLFGCEGGTISDVSFYRVQPDTTTAPAKATVWRPGGKLTLRPPAGRFAPESLFRAMRERYGDTEHRVLSLDARSELGQPVQVAKGQWVHFITPPATGESGLTAVTLEANVQSATWPCTATVAVQDPLDPRIDLTWIDVELRGPGPRQWTFDFPDQVLLPGSQFWLSLRFSSEVTLTNHDGGAPQLRPHVVAPVAALPQALAHRKQLLKHFFSLLSEPRPWGSYHRQPRDEFFASSPYAGQCPELFMTIDLCHRLAPDDPLVRQYRAWVYASHLDKFSDVAPPPAPPDGVPAWAWYPRLAWLETRRIAGWWVEQRMVPTGEFGGRVGDDSDMYQQYLDLPFFESDGVGAALKDGAARMAELADRENLRGGLNKHSTDALHAYEEGINHLALTARWFYGDPIYLERCMDSARNLVHLTVRTDDGRRHFRDKENMGARDMEKSRPPAIDGGSSPLMWHAALQLADYNRNPAALDLMRQWADTWLAFMRPGHWATDIEVATGRVVGVDNRRPLYGGYRSQACVFVWLAHLIGDAKYLEPFFGYYRQGQAPKPANNFLGDVFCGGWLDHLEPARLGALIPTSPELALYLKADPQPLLAAVIGEPVSRQPAVNNLWDAQRWADMYTVTHQYTDRVLPTVLEKASVAYLGGFTRRNKFNPTQAASWEGFGTDYAALVLANRADQLKIAVYSFADQPRTGRLRVWALEHGRYQLSIGTDTDADFAVNRIDRQDEVTRQGRSQSELPLSPRSTPNRSKNDDNEVTLVRADSLPLALPPKAVTIIELQQLEKLEPIFRRADLALAAREIEIRDGQIHGVVHNLGAANVDEVVIAVVDGSGQVLQRQSLGALPAPLDLIPKRKSFTLPLPGGPQAGWRLIVDPDQRIPEIYEGNNAVAL